MKKRYTDEQIVGFLYRAALVPPRRDGKALAPERLPKVVTVPDKCDIAQDDSVG